MKLLLAPTQSPWMQMMAAMVEIPPPTPEQIALWQAEDEYVQKTKSYEGE